MKDNLAKVIIGFVTFSAFCAACSPLFFMNTPNTNTNTKQTRGKYFENKGDNMYTRSDIKRPSRNDNRRSYGRVIYLGEPIDGVMDFN